MRRSAWTVRGTAAAVLAVLLVVGIGGTASADRRRFTDADDSPGILDLRAIGHSHDDKGRLVHTIRTFDRWRTSDLPSNDENYLGILLESRSDKFGSDRFVWVRRSAQGRLYAELYRVLTHANGEFLRRVPVSRPNKYSIRVRIRPSFLGRRFEQGYRWRAITSFEKGRDGPCRRDNEVSSFPTGRCTDAAPGHRRRGLRHSL